jgi:hypothetical protein
VHNVNGVFDYVFKKSAYLNNFFKDEKNVAIKNITLIICSEMINIMMIFTGYNFIIINRSWRILIAIFLFYMLRIICQSIYII